MLLSTPRLTPLPFLSLLTLLLAMPPRVAMAQEAVSFNRDILPVLSDKCFTCHGPDAKRRQADLRLDDRDAAIASGAIAPNDPHLSSLLDRIQSDDASLLMPPPESKLEPLTEKEAQLLSRWIVEGATYQRHWAFLPPTASQEFVRNPSQGIDEAIRAALLQREKLPRQEADRRTLLRRLSFDLIGLPPTPEELRSFESDSSPKAYEKQVDRLLQSPHFGERWASDWLDLARYADSFGFQVDREWEMWPYRDWVIQAFNQNLPFDAFVTWQLAGDLLPNPTREQRIATAYNRLHQQESEGGSVEEEYRVEYVCDRVQTFATSFLGLTFECARCHDHKFDPITQKEFYQLFSIFQNIDEAGLYSYFTESPPTPTISLADDASLSRLRDCQTKVDLFASRAAATLASRIPAFHAWQQAQSASEVPHPLEPPPHAASWLDRDCLAHFSFDSGEAQKYPNRLNSTQVATVHGENQRVPGKNGHAVQFTGDDAVDLPIGNFARHEPFSVSLWINTPDVKERAVLLHRSRAWTDAASRGYELLLEDGCLKWSLIHFWPGNAISIRTQQTIPTNTWVHVVATYDGSSTANGLHLFIDGVPATSDVIRDHLTKTIQGGGGDNIALGERFRDRGFRSGTIDEVRIYRRKLLPIEAQWLFSEFDLDLPSPHTTQSQSAPISPPTSTPPLIDPSSLQDWYLTHRDAEWQDFLNQWTSARQELYAEQDRVREMMGMSELNVPKPAFVLTRGEYAARGEQVFAGTPAILGDFPEQAPKNRLGLAQWLTSSSHPLMARVTVNRFWQALFGRGLVPTSEDFGLQGARPNHPEVLDGLAVSFRERGWDVKQLLKWIVMSHTYRQQSTTERQEWIDDPDNTLLARGPRFRLSAEMIRDNALAVSGLLDRTLGGPSVHPYEMSEAFKPVGPSQGTGVYRRSIYTKWRRTAPPPALLAFDAPRRAVCTAKRERTDSPLQALVMLNGIQYVEAARVLAERCYLTTQGDPNGIIDAAFEACLSRLPDPFERSVLQQLYQEQLTWFESHPDEAKQLLSIGNHPASATIPLPQLAAATQVAQAVLNHDACIVKR